MKRVGYLYEKIIDIKNIENAIKGACKYKKKNAFILELLQHKTKYAIKIKDIITNDKFVPKIIQHKIIRERDKIREIAVPRFYPDQIIHWAICIQLQPIIMRGMYKYNCGSIPTRGCLYAKKYVEKIYKRLKDVKSYTMKLDIKKYFSNINQQKLMYLLSLKIKDRKALNLIYKTIDSGEKGLPIGFYTSQWFSNFYLEAVDHYIKEVLKIKYYVRLVDDMVLIDFNKRKLHNALKSIKTFLKNYNLEIKDNWQIWKTFSRPLDFVGYKFYKNKILLRKGILKRFKRQLIRVKKERTLKIVRARKISAYLGWLKHTTVSKQIYQTKIKPICSKKWVGRIISHDSKRSNYDNKKRG